MWQTLFEITNIVALLGWATLIMLPRRGLLLSAVLYAAVGLLCAIYAAVFVALTGNLVDPVTAPGMAPQAGFEYTVQGLLAMFRSEGAIVVGWTHYLAFDLFAGLWIARDADRRGAGRLVQVPFLLATFFAGPIGLLAWLIVRRFYARAGDVARKEI